MEKGGKRKFAVCYYPLMTILASRPYTLAEIEQLNEIQSETLKKQYKELTEYFFQKIYVKN